MSDEQSVREPAKDIHEAMLRVMEAVGYVQKDRVRGINYSVKSEQAVLEGVRQPLIDEGIIMFPTGVNLTPASTITTKKGEIWQRVVAIFTYRFFHTHTGTHIDVPVIGEGTDSGDKASNKAMTASKKYALLEALLLITGDDPDLEASPNAAVAETATVAPRPFTAKQLLANFPQAVTGLEGVELDMDAIAQIGELMNEAVGADNLNTFIAKVFQDDTPWELLSHAQLAALGRWASDAHNAQIEAKSILEMK